MGVQLAAVQTQKEQDIRQKADADVHEQIHQRICREPAAQKGKHEVAPQSNAAEDRHDQIKAVACVAVEPVGKDEQRRDEQQQVEDLARAVVAPAQDGAQHPQRGQRPDGQQQAEMAVGRVVQQQEIKRPGHHHYGRQQKSDNLIQERGTVDARRSRREISCLRRARQAVLAQRAVGAVPADLDMTMRAGIHFSTSVA